MSASPPVREAKPVFGARIKGGGAEQVVCGSRYDAEWIYVQCQGGVGCGKRDQTGGASGRRTDARTAGRRNDGEISQAKGPRAALGVGKFLQRDQAHDGFNVDFAQTRATLGRSTLSEYRPKLCAVGRSPSLMDVFNRATVLLKKPEVTGACPVFFALAVLAPSRMFRKIG